MRISAKLSVIIAAIFAAMCFGVAITGFTSIGEIADPVQRADGLGFAWFWAFLGSIAVAVGAAGFWIVKTHGEDDV